MQKLSCYVDETGQDTEGTFFLVALLVTSPAAAQQLEQRLVQIEQMSGKRYLKWTATSVPRRQVYLSRIIELPELQASIFYSAFMQTKDYTNLTAQVIAAAIRVVATTPYSANIFIDGLNDVERDHVRRYLKRARIAYRTVRGLRDESSALIRLCDALAGLLRDFEESKPYAKPLVAKMHRRALIKNV